MPYKILAFVAAALLLVALAPLPYGYYTLLRIVVCGVSIYGVVLAIGEGRVWWAVGLGLLAVLFNPFIQISLDRTVWSVLNVATAVAMVVSATKVGTLLESEPGKAI